MKKIHRILLPIYTAMALISCERLGDIHKSDSSTNAGGYHGDVESVTSFSYAYKSSKESQDSIKVYSGKTKTQYNVRGKITSSIVYDEHDIITSQTFYKYEYDTNGRIATITMECHHKSGTINIQKSTHQYDLKGKVTRVISHYSDNKSEEVRIDTTDNRYDFKGRAIESITYNGPHIKAKTVITYTSFDEILTNKHESHSVSSTGYISFYHNSTYTYNQANVMIEGTHETTHVNGGECRSWTSKCIYEHDINGNLIYQDTYQDSRLVETYECEYDSRNNHTKEIFYNYVEGIKTPFIEYEHQITYRD